MKSYRRTAEYVGVASVVALFLTFFVLNYVHLPRIMLDFLPVDLQRQIIKSAAPLPPEDSTGLYMRFISVGKGDAALFECDGQSLLIDGGHTIDGARVVAFLRAHGVDKLNYLVSTHPHEDHIGGLIYLLKKVPVGTIYDFAEDYSTATYRRYMDAASANGAQRTYAFAGESFALGNARVDILWPIRGRPLDETTNNNSTALMITYGKTAALMTGDLQSRGESGVMLNSANLSADVLKVAHHGMSGSSKKAFLERVSPSFAIVTTDELGLSPPSADVLKRLNDINCLTYRTDTHGDITLFSDGKGVKLLSTTLH